MASLHVRSISLPSTSHPLTLSLVEQISNLKSSSICHKLAGLKELYESFDDFLHLSFAQQTLSHKKQNQSVEEALNRSLSLLDMCSTTKDLFSQMRDCVQGLESSLRRSSSEEVDAYTVSRKNLNKVICKYLKTLRKQEKNCRFTALSILKDVEEISVTVFESMLSFISFPKEKSKLSIVSKILKTKKVEDEETFKELEAFPLSLQEAEEELECLYRRLVKIRVSLLNILNHQGDSSIEPKKIL